MVKLCNQYPFAYCIKRKFSEIDFVEEFDGVWACASLIHVPPNEMLDALSRLVVALKFSGWLYFSLKTEQGINNHSGRITYFHDDKTIQNLMEKELFCTKVSTWINETKKPNNKTCWQNYVYMKSFQN